ncbi:hypothetical protein [Streptomyces sp. NBC_01497]|uniref:hypothetical protein n=1 Tax=Streptomyces sp. NBC_01497 TaxID=2903885 RepID=UPI002E344042|nr:hypothetical protein [Streptomyces sp. NBC_01497]
MSAHTLTPTHGATATGIGALSHPGHGVGETLRAVKVFVATAFNVAVLGEYAEEAGIQRRHAVPAPRAPHGD